jgi:hypothetical protein
MMYHDFEDLVQYDKRRCLSWDLPRLQAFVESEKAWFRRKWKREDELHKGFAITYLHCRTRVFEYDYIEFLEFLIVVKTKMTLIGVNKNES